MHRHGSRGPAGEMPLLNSLVQKLREGHDAIQHAYLPKNLRFLKKGYELNLEEDRLSIIGRQQLFNHGVEYACPIQCSCQMMLMCNLDSD